MRTIAHANDGSGKLYVGGDFRTFDDIKVHHLARLNSDGSLDTSFDMSTGANDRVFTLAPATDASGDLYVGGHFTSINGVETIRLARLNSDGSVDTAYDMSTYGVVYALAPTRDGSGDLYVGGNFTSINGVETIGLARLNSDGSVDTAFDMSKGGVVKALAPTRDGSGDLYVGGNFTSINGVETIGLARLNSDGSVDTTFDMSKKGVVNALSPTSAGSGDILVGGDFFSINGVISRCLARFISSGVYDSDFYFESGGVSARIFALTPAKDGSGDLYVGGEFTSINGVETIGLARLNSDGSVDTAFDMSKGGYVKALAPTRDGSGDLYVGGKFTSINGVETINLARLNSDGSVDTTFDMSKRGYVKALAPASDGSGDIYVGGYLESINGIKAICIAKLNSDSSVDTAFYNNTGDAGGCSVATLAPATDGSGDLYVGGHFYAAGGSYVYKHLARLDSDGGNDSAFVARFEFRTFVNAIVPATDGSGGLYVAGDFCCLNDSVQHYLARLNSDGTADTTYKPRISSSINAIALATDGSGDLYVGGKFTRINGVDTYGLARLNSDGTLDTAFDMSTGTNGPVSVLAPADDGSGDLYVGGDDGALGVDQGFTSINNVTTGSLARLHPDGRVD